LYLIRFSAVFLKLNLDTLELWRIKSDLVLCYKIIFGVVHLNTRDFLDLATTSTRGHQFEFYKHFSCCSVQSSFFSERIINIWNRLPVDIVDFSSLSSFGNSLDAMNVAVLTDV